jgi:hypothetical protein
MAAERTGCSGDVLSPPQRVAGSLALASGDEQHTVVEPGRHPAARLHVRINRYG